MNLGTYLIGLFVLCGIGTATAEPAGPPAGYKIEPEYTQTSPDGAITIEQYVNKDTWKWQFWVRRKDTFTLLDEQADYPAGFRFTNDLKWIVRMQKTGSGVPPRSAWLRSREQETARRSGVGLHEGSARVAKAREGPRVSHHGESVEGD